MPLERTSGGTPGAASSGVGAFGLTRTRPPPPSSDHSRRAPRRRSMLADGMTTTRSSCVIPDIALVRIRGGLEVEVVHERPGLYAPHLEPEGQAARVGLLLDRLAHDFVRLGGERHDGDRGLQFFGGSGHGAKSTASARASDTAGSVTPGRTCRRTSTRVHPVGRDGRTDVDVAGARGRLLPPVAGDGHSIASRAVPSCSLPTL